MLPRTQKARKEIRLSRVQFLWYWLSGQEEYEKSPLTDNWANNNKLDKLRYS